MVAGHMGSTLLPEMALDQLLDGSNELRAIKLQEASPHRRIAFITRLNYAGVPNIEILKELFRRELNAAANRTRVGTSVAGDGLIGATKGFECEYWFTRMSLSISFDTSAFRRFSGFFAWPK